MLCYGGQAAAAAAKVGRPLDLRCVAARIDAGALVWGAGWGRWLASCRWLSVAAA